MKVSGTNRFNQLYAKSTNKNIDGTPIIYPLINSKHDPTQLLSFSIYNEHSVWITPDGQAYAIGDNRYSQIIESLPKRILPKATQIIIQDQEGKKYHPLSAVCGETYTLYLVSHNHDTQSTKLAYSYRDHNDNCPLFLNSDDRHPVALFGGSHTSAAIDSEGCVMIITSSVLNSHSHKIESVQLPRGEKAVNIACCDDYVIVLSMSGRVYECTLTNDASVTFSEIVDFVGLKISSVSGSHHHCFAVSSDGLVFGRGSNKQGRLGLDIQIEHVEKFTVLTSLKKYKIYNAYAGYSHSLFQTFNGMIFACGDNYNGNLLLSAKPAEDDFCIPTATTVTSGASSCIAGWNLSVVFVDCNMPPNSPNQQITDLKNNITGIELNSVHKAVSAKDRNEDPDKHEKKCIKELESLVESKQRRIEELENEILKIKGKRSNSMDDNDKEIRVLDSETFHSLKTVREISKDEINKVYEVVKEESFVLKTMKIKNWNSEIQRKFVHQLETLKTVNHPNFLKVYGIYISDNSQSVLLECCQMNLHQVIKKNAFSKIQLVCSIYQIAESMKCAHFLGIIHKNLKPSNIMVASNNLIKISDFGSSVLKSANDDKFSAPELFINNEKYDEKVDVYSFGVLALFLLSGKKPKVSISSLLNGKQQEIPDSINKFSKELIQKCISMEPKNRPSFEDICNEISENKYQLADLNKLEFKEALIFIQNYKRQIPSYSD